MAGLESELVPAVVSAHSDSSGSSPEGPQGGGVGEDGVCCPNCGQEVKQEQLLTAITE